MFLADPLLLYCLKMADTAVTAAAAAAAAVVSDQAAAVQPKNGSRSSRMGAGKAGANRGENGCYFADSSATGSPFMVSGELFLRSTQKLLFSSGNGSSDLVGVPPSSSDQYLQQQQPRHATTAATTATAYANAASSAADHPSAGLLAGLSRDLRELLLCHPDVYESPPPSTTAPTTTTSTASTSSNGGISDGGLPGLVSSAREERRFVRRKTVACLETSKTIAGCLVTARLSAVHKAVGGFRQGCGEGRAQLDTRLGSLVLK